MTKQPPWVVEMVRPVSLGSRVARGEELMIAAATPELTATHYQVDERDVPRLDHRHCWSL